ncbi:MAG: alpha/beta fold hydrolase [Candidatus Levyibacteriota bacterium]
MQLRIAGKDVYAYTGTRGHDPASPTMVFVHGAANDHSVFALQSRYFAWHGWNVLAIDLPGHGRSEGPALADVRSIADWIAAVVAACAGTSPRRNAVLVGHSLGALAALECAARHPQSVAKIALLGPAVPMPVSDDLLAAAARNDHVAYEMINGWSYAPGSQIGGNRNPGLWMLGSAMRLMERTSEGVLSTDLLACHRYADGLAAAAALRCPALVVMGERDVMAPPRNAKSLIGALPDAHSVTLPGCGHALTIEQPDAVLEALRSFIGAAVPAV